LESDKTIRTLIMKIKYTIICLLASLGVANAQYQNFNLSAPDTNAKTYIGRDYVKFLPGYTFTAATGMALDAIVQTGLTPTQASTFMASANPTADPSITPDQLTAINTNLAVGQIPISSSVSPNGAKCYNVPIEIVPGRQGFQPNISLSYNSQGGNGLVGMGWSISGLSSIERVNKNMFFDGTDDVPNLKDKDAFMLDGVRLIEKSRTKSQINYETVQGNITVIASFVGTIIPFKGIIFSTTDIGFFKVMYPNGSTAIFGDNTSAKLSYPITTLTDLSGSIITFSYLLPDNIDLNGGNNNEVYYIDEINYGQCSDMPNFAKVKFKYQSRNDKIFSLQSTKSIIFRQRLNSIEISANSNMIRAYNLTYSNTDTRINANNQLDVSRLAQIDCSAGSESLNPLKFYYGESGTPTIITNPTSLNYSDLSNVNFIRGKFDPNPNSDAVLTFPKADSYERVENSIPYNYTLTYPEDNNLTIYQNLNSAGSINTTISAESGFLDVKSGNIDGLNGDEIIKINSQGLPNYEEGTSDETINFKIYKSNNTSGLDFIREESLKFETIDQAPYGDPSNLTLVPKKFITGNKFFWYKCKI